MTHMEHARQLRASVDVHYNCFQSVVLPFAKEIGLTEEQVYALGMHFGSGMRHGAACGTLSGTLMVLGALGYDEQKAAEVIRQFRQAHGATDCATLLKASHDRGEVRHDHCSNLVYEMVALLDELVK